MMEENSPAEFDIKNIIGLLWRNKLVFIVGFVFSFILSSYYISTSKKIYEAITIVELEKTSQASAMESFSINAGDQAQRLSSILAGVESTQDPNIIPTITGREFLLSFVKKYDVAEKIGYRYSFSEPKLFSFLGISNALGLYEVVPPTEEQGDETIVNKIRSLISLERFRYKQIKTKAFKIKIQYSDPYIAAFIANKLAEHFFEFMKAKEEEEYKSQIRFLSSVVTEAQVSYAASQNALEVFLIKHPSFFGDNILSDSFSSIFPNIDKAAELVDLTSQKNELELSIEKLQAVFLKDNLFARDFDTVTSRGNVSNSFLKEVQKLDSVTVPTEEMIVKLKEEISKELVLLGSLLSKTNKFLQEREKEVSDDLDLSDTFNELKLSSALNKNYVETTKSSLNTLSLKASSETIKNRQVYSLATPPIHPIKPNVRYIFMIHLAIFAALATIFVFLKQFVNPTIFDLNQLKRHFGFGELIRVSKGANFFSKKYSDSDGANLKGVSLGFFNALIQNGKVGCLIEIGKKSFFKQNLSSTLALQFSMLLASDKNYTICISEDFNSSNNSFEIEESIDKSFNEKKRSQSKNGLVTSGSEISNIKNFQFFPIKEPYQKFDKMLIAAPKNLMPEAQFSLIKNCDFFILFGRAGYFSREHLDHFITDTSLLKEKCLGFVLVD